MNSSGVTAFLSRYRFRKSTALSRSKPSCSPFATLENSWRAYASAQLMGQARARAQVGSLNGDQHQLRCGALAQQLDQQALTEVGGGGQECRQIRRVVGASYDPEAQNTAPTRASRPEATGASGFCRLAQGHDGAFAVPPLQHQPWTMLSTAPTNLNALVDEVWCRRVAAAR